MDVAPPASALGHELPQPPSPPLPPPPARRDPRARRGIVAIAILVATLVFASLAAVSFNGSELGGLSKGPHVFENLNPDGSPVRWNPCQPITYQLNLTDAPPTAMADAQEAIRRVSQATGIRFVYEGTTTRTADQQMGAASQFAVPAGDGRWDPLLISWAPHSHVQYLLNDPNVYAFAQPKEGDGSLANEYVSGVVVVDAGNEAAAGFYSFYSQGTVLQHELGHIMGLDHVADNGQLMYSVLEDTPTPHPDFTLTDWGPGDLQGLRELGRPAGCLPNRG